MWTIRTHDEGRPAISDRIDEVLADLTGQLEAAEAAELAAEVEDRTRRETGLLLVADRVRASVGDVVAVTTVTGTLAGTLAEAGPDWIRLDGPAIRSVVVPLAAAVAVSGLRAAALTDAGAGAVAARLDLRHVLRQLVRDRRPVRVLARDGRYYAGLLNRCGGDFLELAGPAAHRVGRQWLVPLAAIEAVYLD